MFASKCSAVFRAVFETPQLLKQLQPAVRAKLRAQSKSEGQGTGNQVTDHEASMAAVFETHGFTFLPKDKKGDHLKTLLDFPSTGHYYIYQVNGTQASIDFQLLNVVDHEIKNQVSIDLKHSTGDKIMLNDGWFHENIVYVVTYKFKKQLRTLVALGQNVPTAEENKNMADFKAVIAELRKKYKEMNKNSSLTLYPRSANQYSCRRFDQVFCSERFEEVMKCSLLSSSECVAPLAQKKRVLKKKVSEASSAE